MGKTKSTVDENGKFSYFSADMRPVPPGRSYTEFLLILIVLVLWL